MRGMEIGLGFIITVIIAVMALVLIVQFLQTTVPKIQDLTTNAIDTAASTLSGQIGDGPGKKSFGIALPKERGDDGNIKPIAISKQSLPLRIPVLILKDSSKAYCYQVTSRVVTLHPTANQYYQSNGLSSQSMITFDMGVVRLSPDPNKAVDRDQKINVFVAQDAYEGDDIYHTVQIILQQVDVLANDDCPEATASGWKSVNEETVDFVIKP